MKRIKFSCSKITYNYVFLVNYFKLLGVLVEEGNSNFEYDSYFYLSGDILDVRDSLNKNEPVFNFKLDNGFDCLIDNLYENDIINEDERDSFNLFLPVYSKYNLSGVSLLIPISPINKKEYETINNICKTACIELRNTLKTLDVAWGDERYVNLQLAVLNISYNISLLAHKCKFPMPYTPDSIIRICDKLSYYGESVLVLKGKAYSRLKDESYNSVDLFKKLDKNCEAIQELGHFSSESGRYNTALKSYDKCLSLYPSCVNAYYGACLCCFHLKKYDESISYFEKVVTLLNNKVLLPNEVIILCTSLIKMGSIFADNICNKKNDALKYYKVAIKLINGIGDLEFFNFLILDDKRDLEVKNRIKKMFNIKRVYSKVSILYDSIGNRKLAEEYYKLYEEC